MLSQIRALLENYPLGLTAEQVCNALESTGLKVREREVTPLLKKHFGLAIPNKERYCVEESGFTLPSKPSALPITYLANRSVTVRDASDKARIRKMGTQYHKESNYSVHADTFLNAFKDTSQRGHQMILGGFYRRHSRNGKLSVKSNECLAYLQMVMVEFDDDLGYESLSDMAERHPFIRDNAVLLMESTSGFPKSRAFFALPNPQSFSKKTNANDWAQARFLIRMLLTEFNGKADQNGSNPSNGCFGRVKGDYILIDKWIQPDVMRRWGELWKLEPKRTPEATQIEDSELSKLPQEYQDALKDTTADAHGWYGRFPCPHENHEHDSWEDGSNACSIRPQGRGFVTACWKCERDDISKPKYRYIGRSRAESTKTGIAEQIKEIHAIEAAFVERMLDGDFDIPEPPTYEEVAEGKHRQKLSDVREGKKSPLELLRPKAVLQKSNRVQEVITLMKSDSELRQAFLKNSRLIAVNAPTGAGKDETHMSVVLDSNLHSIETKPHHRVAEEKVERWGQLSTTVAHWTGVMHGAHIVEAMEWDERIEDPFPEDGSWKCVQPTKVWAYMQQGGNRHLGICQDCEVRDACYAIGFNSQSMHAKGKRAIVTAIPDLFINPIYESFSEKLYVVAPKDEELGAQESVGEGANIRLAVMDEVDPTNLFLNCRLSMGQLQSWRIMWHTAELGEFASKLEGILVQEQSITALSEYILSIDDDLVRTLGEQMGKVRTSYTSHRHETVDYETDDVLSSFKLVFPNGSEACLAKDYRAYQILRNKEVPVVLQQEIAAEGIMEVTLDVAFRVGIYGNPAEMDAEDIESILPQVYSENWNPLLQLQLLFRRYPVEGAPIHFKQNALEWEVPPQLHEHIQRMLCMSATVYEPLFRRALSAYENDIEFVSVSPTPLIEGSRIFQLRTGKYCRGTVLEWDDKMRAIGLKKAGKKLWDMFKTEVERDVTVKHALITYQCILDWNSEWLESNPNVIASANYWGLEGINEMQDADYVWVMFDPELDGKTIERYSKRFWGDDEEPLNFDREDGCYVDERVYLVWESQVIGELLQAVGRARLNRKKGNVVVLTGLEIPTVTNRAETLLFDFVDWEIDKNLPEWLEFRIRQRELQSATHAAHDEDVIEALQRGESMNSVSKKYHRKYHEVRKLKENMTHSDP